MKFRRILSQNSDSIDDQLYKYRKAETRHKGGHQLNQSADSLKIHQYSIALIKRIPSHKSKPNARRIKSDGDDMLRKNVSSR